ncbi:MAG: MFS transporter [Burkholderiaceae bacterium]
MVSEGGFAHPAWRLVLPFGLAYAMSYALRTINAVLAPELVAGLGLSAAELGLLASAYFLAFASMQLPLGVLLDRFGPRRVEASLLVAAIAGCLISAMAQGFWTLWIGRALIGLGVSACLMASYKAYRMVFEERLQAPLASTMLVIGSIGALAATSPVEWLLAITDWRGVFVVLTLLFVGVWMGIAFGLPPLPQPSAEHTAPGQLWSQAAQGFRTIFRHPEFARMFPFAFVTYGGFLAMHGLWLGPWFTEVEGQTPGQAATGLLILTAVIMMAHLGMAYLANHLHKKNISLNHAMHWGLAFMAVFSGLAVLDVWPHPWLGWSLAFVSAGVTTIGYTRFAAVFPLALSGRATTGFNFVIFIGAFAVQWGIGLLIDAFVALSFDKPMAIRLAVGVWVVAQVLALYWLIRAPKHPVGPRPA